MKKIAVMLVTAVVVLFLAGCSQTITANREMPYHYGPKSVDLVMVSHDVVEKLEQNMKVPISPDDTIIVASFVDVNDLKVSSRFGRIMAEQVGSRLAQKGYKVIELKLRQNSVFVEEGKGEFLLSRDLRDISVNHNASAVVVGTYTHSYDRIYLSTRIVNPSDSVILAACDLGMPADANLQASLLVDQP